MAKAAKRAFERIGKTLKWAISSPAGVASENIYCHSMGWSCPLSPMIWINDPLPIMPKTSAEEEHPRC